MVVVNWLPRTVAWVTLQVKGLSNSFAEPEGSPLTWRTDMRYSGLNIGVMGIFYEPLQRCHTQAYTMHPSRAPEKSPDAVS